MRSPLDPENWGDYPTAADLAPDLCAEKGCRECNQMPYSNRCYWHASVAEQREIEQVAAEDASADQDWGTEAC